MHKEGGKKQDLFAVLQSTRSFR